MASGSHSLKSVDLLPQDEREVLRVVGFLEYGMALERFDRLAAICKPEELKALDALVKERDELVVFTNLSRRLQRGPSALAETPRAADDTFERRGLAWIMALARVEVGAMLAAFTEVVSPFEKVAGGGYDRAEYQEMLLDGMRTHYWALAGDANAAAVLKRKPTNETLNYIRRLTMVMAFQQAVAKLVGPMLSPPQAQELVAWRKQARDYTGSLLAQLQSSLGPGAPATDLAAACGNACQRLQQFAE
jgi:hypothetical protein